MMTIMDRIELNPKVCNGKPVIKGTRIPVSVILEQIAQVANPGIRSLFIESWGRHSNILKNR
jgi:Protein of unknown function (DUF433)